MLQDDPLIKKETLHPGTKCVEFKPGTKVSVPSIACFCCALIFIQNVLSCDTFMVKSNTKQLCLDVFDSFDCTVKF